MNSASPHIHLIFLSLIFQEEDSEFKILPWIDCIYFGTGERVTVTVFCSYYYIASYPTCIKELAEKEIVRLRRH